MGEANRRRSFRALHPDAVHETIDRIATEGGGVAMSVVIDQDSLQTLCDGARRGDGCALRALHVFAEVVEQGRMPCACCDRVVCTATPDDCGAVVALFGDSAAAKRCMAFAVCRDCYCSHGRWREATVKAIARRASDAGLFDFRTLSIHEGSGRA